MESDITNVKKDVIPTDPNRGESVLPTKPVANLMHGYDSLLKLDNVRSEHYSTVFTCIANNSYGTDHADILLVPPGQPDPPSEIDVISTTHERVTLTWRPGFNGGYNQTYVITVLEQKTGREVKQDVLDTKELGWWINSTQVSGLQPHTSYLIRVQAKNKAGMSEAAEEVFVKTRRLEHAKTEVEELPRVVVISIVLGVIMVVLTGVIIVVCCCKHKILMAASPQAAVNLHARSKQPGKSESRNPLHSSSKNLIVERYTPAKFNNQLFYSSFEDRNNPPAQGQGILVRSNSSSSSTGGPKVDYKDLARSLSMPSSALDAMDMEDDEDGPLYLPNGDPYRFRTSSTSRGAAGKRTRVPDGSCSLHNTLTRRSGQRHSSIGCNTTMEDDVFEDSDLTNSGVAPSSANPLLDMARGGTMFPQLVGSRLASNGRNNLYTPVFLSQQQQQQPSNGDYQTHQSPFRRSTEKSTSSSFYYPQTRPSRSSTHHTPHHSWRDLGGGESSSPPNSPLRHFTLATTTLPRKSPNNGVHGHALLNGGLNFIQPGTSSTLGRTKSKSSAWLGGVARSSQQLHQAQPAIPVSGTFGLKKLKSADRLMNWSQRSDSPPLPPPPPPPVMASLRHMNYEAKPSLIV